MFRRIGLFAVTVIIVAFIGTAESNDQSKVEFKILPESVICLSGHSNVAKFSCELQNNFISTKQAMAVIISDDLMKIDGAVIEIIIENFDCGNVQMNRDMQVALKSDQYPSMFLRILETNYKGGAQEILKNGYATALTEITIGNVSKTVLINFDKIELNDTKLLFAGCHEIDMREFDISPPKVFFGLVKVNEIITIDFNLSVQLEL